MIKNIILLAVMACITGCQAPSRTSTLYNPEQNIPLMGLSTKTNNPDISKAVIDEIFSAPAGNVMMFQGKDVIIGNTYYSASDAACKHFQIKNSSENKALCVPKGDNKNAKQAMIIRALQ